VVEGKKAGTQVLRKLTAASSVQVSALSTTVLYLK
jgi:hypothetical protein